MIFNFQVESRLGLRCAFMSNSSSPQSTSETQYQAQVAGNGGVTSGALIVSGNPNTVNESTTESDGGIAASGNAEVSVTTDDPQVVEAALSSNTMISNESELASMQAATASNNALTTLEQDFQDEQSQITAEAASVNLTAANAPAAAYNAYENTAATTSQTGSANVTTLYYVAGIAAAAVAIFYYLKK